MIEEDKEGTRRIRGAINHELVRVHWRKKDSRKILVPILKYVAELLMDIEKIELSYANGLLVPKDRVDEDGKRFHTDEYRRYR